MERLAFNPRPRLAHQVLAPCREVWVVDDILQDPLGLRAVARAGRQHFVAAPYNAYPGLEWRMDEAVSAPLAEFFMLHLRSRMGARRTRSMYSRLSLATLQPAQLSPLQRLCHRDRMGAGADECVVACTLYLFDEPALGGTAFYAPRVPVPEIDARIRHWHSLSDAQFTAEIGAAPGYLTAGNAWFEQLAVVPAIFNRAVFYDGSGFHTSHITAPELLCEDPARGRLTLNGFFVCRRQAW
jgi:hypothetical protein